MSSISIKAITRGALTIALICVFFTLFKGVTNIFNALLIPLTLYLSVLNLRKREIFLIYSALALICFIFFKVQLIFVFFYCLIGLLLCLLHRKKIPFFPSFLFLTVAIGMSFWLSILLTDYLFLTHMNDIMMKALKGSITAYMLMLAFESALVAAGQLMLSKLFYKRLNSF